MDYSFKPTTHGRAALAACMALGVAPDICRVTFGSGKIDEAVNLADQHELLEPVSDGTIANRRHRNDHFYFEVQYANSQHPDIGTFMLSEFVVNIIDPDTGNETDLLYGTLGDYRLPVPRYHESIAPSVFNLPLVVVISDDLEVHVSAPPGLVTFDDLMDAVGQAVEESAGNIGGGAGIYNITIPATGWDTIPEEDMGMDWDEYRYFLDVLVPDSRENLFPSVALHRTALDTAQRAGLCPTAQTLEGKVRFWAMNEPQEDMAATLILISEGGGVGPGGGGGSYVLPVASATTLGGIKLGSGLSMAPDGTASVDMNALSDESVAAIAEKVQPNPADVNAMLDEVFQPYNPEE